MALCVYLLTAYLKFVSKTGYGLLSVLRLVQLNAFTCKPSAELLCPDKRPPPDPRTSVRLRVA